MRNSSTNQVVVEFGWNGDEMDGSDVVAVKHVVLGAGHEEPVLVVAEIVIGLAIFRFKKNGEKTKKKAAAKDLETLKNENRNSRQVSGKKNTHSKSRENRVKSGLINGINRKTK